MGTTGGIKVFSGNANPKLAEEIARHLGCDMGRAFAERFSDGEFNFQIDENVRGGDVFIVQPTCPPTDEHLMELLIMLDAFRRSSAERITAVIPYYGYGRSDKKDRPRVPISARLVANLITVAGADRLLTIDLHAAQIQGFFDIPVDHLYSAPVMIGYYQENPLTNLTVVAPDTGGAERARAYAKRLDAELAPCDKRREKANVADDVHHLGYVRFLAPLIAQCQFCIQSFGVCTRPFGAASVRRNHRQVRQRILLIVTNHDRRGVKVVNRNIKEPLDLRGMQVYCQQAIGAGHRNQVRHQPG